MCIQLIVKLFLFILCSGLENTTFISNVWQVVFAYVLIGVRLLTIMYIASLMALAMFCPPFPIILKFCTGVMWPCR